MNVSTPDLMKTLAGSFNLASLEWLDKIIAGVKWGSCDFIGLYQVCNCMATVCPPPLHPELMRDLEVRTTAGLVPHCSYS